MGGFQRQSVIVRTTVFPFMCTEYLSCIVPARGWIVLTGRRTRFMCKLMGPVE